VILEHDVLTAHDRELLQELARRLRPHSAEIVTGWADAWEKAVPVRGVDPKAYRQLIQFVLEGTVHTWLEHIGEGNFEGLYDFQYRTNREGARSQLGTGAIALFNQRELHLVGRVGQPIICEWIGRAFADDPARAVQTQLAQERLGSQLGMILSEAYSDERESHLESVSRRLRRALEISERLRSVGQAIVQSLDIEPVLALTLRTAIQLTSGDSAGLTIANREGSALQLRRLVGGDRQEIIRWVPVEGSLSGWVYRNDQVLRSDHEGGPQDPSIADQIRARAIRAWLIVPLHVGGKPIGTLGVSSRTVRQFSGEEEGVLQSLADSVAIAIENARVHAEVRDALREAERANNAKSEFVAAVSHEIRSPLAAMVGYVQLLREGSFGPVTPEQSEALERLESISASTLRLTSDLLEHARLEAGALPVHPARVAIRPLLDEVKETAQMLIDARPVRFDTVLSPDVEAVRADRDRLQQILLNLLTNAAKFTNHGSIALSVSPSSRPGLVDFVVRDTGTGIHPQDLPRIFDLFYRADQSSTAGGAGIGLFLSRRLAALMEGDLTVQSQLGEGSIFTLTLPASEPR
jgi:signal transduction histidine kinase